MGDSRAAASLFANSYSRTTSSPWPCDCPPPFLSRSGAHICCPEFRSGSTFQAPSFTTGFRGKSVIDRINSGMSEVSSTRLYLGNLPRNGTPAPMSSMIFLHQIWCETKALSNSLDCRCRNGGTAVSPSAPSGTLVQADSSLLRILATKQDIEDHFSTHGTGKITEIKLMNGFGFIEYEDAMDARGHCPRLASY